MKTIEQIIGKLKKVEAETLDQIDKRFPPGTEVQWPHGKYQRRGVIVELHRGYSGAHSANFRITAIPSGIAVRQSALYIAKLNG